MRESQIETKCREYIQGFHDGYMLKLQGLGMLGWPDRIVIMPGAFICFVELKRPGKTPSHIQSRRLRKLRQLGFHAFWADDFGVFQFEILRRLKQPPSHFIHPED